MDNLDSAINKNHKKLKTIVNSLHGGESWVDICYLEKNRIKIERRAADLLWPSFNLHSFLVLKMDPRWDSKRRHLFYDTVDNPVSANNNNHISLRTIIISLRGGEFLVDSYYLEKIWIKISRRAADHHFLKECRDLNLIPDFACINLFFTFANIIDIFTNLALALFGVRLRAPV